MLSIIRYSLHDMFRHHKLWLAMALLVAATNIMYLVLGGYRSALHQELNQMPYNDLVVEESNTNGEIYGSRISPQIGESLLAMGVSQAIAEIHEYTGTSITNILMLRGIDLARYQDVNSFTILAGQALQSGSAPRTAMVGWRLAEKLKLSPGQQITIRGRQFLVSGIFQTGTYVDNEAWISLEDAQALLGWSNDVSILIIPDEGILKAGDTLPGGFTVAKRGLGPQSSREKFEPLFRVIDLTYITISVAVILTLANVLFRTAWIHRRELAILRCVGFPSHALVIYLLSQAMILTWASVILGTIITTLVFSVLRTDMAGMIIQPRIDLQTGLAGFGQVTAIAIFGALLPAWWLSRLNLASQLRSE